MPLFGATAPAENGATQPSPREGLALALSSAILDSIDASIAVVGADGTILAVNAAWNRYAAQHGTGADAVAGASVGDNYLSAIRTDTGGATDEDARRALAGIRSVMDGRCASFSLDYPCHGPGGRAWCTLRATPLAGLAGVVVISHLDITERVLAQERQRISAIAFELDVGMVITDGTGLILEVNRAFCRVTGYEASDVIGSRAAVLASGRHDAEFYRAMWQSLLESGRWQGDIWNRRKSGVIGLDRMSISAVVSDSGATTHYVAAFTDVTRERVAESRVHELSYYDPLTLMPNRRLLYEAITRSLADCRRSRRYGAAVCLDLDHFKNINDTLGHDAGDRFLIECAARIKLALRAGDAASRIGGDAFTLVLNDLSADAREAASLAGAIADRLCEVIALPFMLDGTELHCTASIGVALFNGDDASADAIFKNAELAMHQAKATGTNALRFFDPAAQAALAQRMELEADLRKALELGQMELHYQSQHDGSGRLIGAEALLRWTHPTRGPVSPVEFIPLAEESGLILSIGHWVLATACRQIAAWSASTRTRSLLLAVNVSARQFQQADFVEQVRTALAQSGADPSRLKIELTESMVLNDVPETREKMQVLKSMGIGLSLDDFGTGNSSLSYLTRLPLDQLKIDRSFVRNLPESRSDAVIAQTIIAMANGLGLHVIAEGVENEAQRAFLENNGCFAYQGYLFSRPLPLEAFEGFVGGDRFTGQDANAVTLS